MVTGRRWTTVTKRRRRRASTTTAIEEVDAQAPSRPRRKIDEDIAGSSSSVSRGSRMSEHQTSHLRRRLKRRRPTDKTAIDNGRSCSDTTDDATQDVLLSSSTTGMITKECRPSHFIPSSTALSACTTDGLPFLLATDAGNSRDRRRCCHILPSTRAFLLKAALALPFLFISFHLVHASDTITFPAMPANRSQRRSTTNSNQSNLSAVEENVVGSSISRGSITFVLQPRVGLSLTIDSSNQIVVLFDGRKYPTDFTINSSDDCVMQSVENGHCAVFWDGSGGFVAGDGREVGVTINISEVAGGAVPGDGSSLASSITATAGDVTSPRGGTAKVKEVTKEQQEQESGGGADDWGRAGGTGDDNTDTKMILTALSNEKPESANEKNNRHSGKGGSTSSSYSSSSRSSRTVKSEGKGSVRKSSKSAKR